MFVLFNLHFFFYCFHVGWLSSNRASWSARQSQQHRVIFFMWVCVWAEYQYPKVGWSPCLRRIGYTPVCKTPPQCAQGYRQWASFFIRLVGKVTDMHRAKPHGFPSNSSNWNSYKCIELCARRKVGKKSQGFRKAFTVAIRLRFVTKLCWLALSPTCLLLVCTCRALGGSLVFILEVGIGPVFCLVAAK